ncbi:cytochrome P450 [Streptomyces sioyaensis]|uniref:cytochrome P450 family protein n=1 Tax=Streptomyces sioyaensis TaxID=67364 RepID=UPI0033E7668B
MTPKTALPQPFAEQHAVDPYPAYRALLDQGGMHRMTLRPGLEAWLVVDHGLVREALTHPAISLESRHATPEAHEAIMAGYTEEKQSFFGQHLLAVDGADHTRMRRVMSRALTARRFQAMAPEVETIAHTLLDDLPAPGHADLTSALVVPFTISVLARLMGVPEPGRKLLTDLANKVVQGQAEEDDGFGQVIAELTGYFSDLLDSPDEVPADSLLAMLIDARADGAIRPEETLSLVYQLFFAGHESSAYLMTNAIAVLLSRPDAAAELRSHPDLLDGAVEELLRWEGSIKVGSWRFATEPLELGGNRLQTGDPILVVLAAANRDPEKFAAPDDFDIRRQSVPHVAFGHGPHHCLGAALGRLEARTLLSALLTRFPDIALDIPYEDLHWRHNLIMRGPSHLPVTLGEDRHQ